MVSAQQTQVEGGRISEICRSFMSATKTDRQADRAGGREDGSVGETRVHHEPLTLKGPSSCLELISHHIFGRTHWMTSYSSMSASSKGQSLSVLFLFYQDYLFILTFILRVTALQG